MEMTVKPNVALEVVVEDGGATPRAGDGMVNYYRMTGPSAQISKLEAVCADTRPTKLSLSPLMCYLCDRMAPTCAHMRPDWAKGILLGTRHPPAAARAPPRAAQRQTTQLCRNSPETCEGSGQAKEGAPDRSGPLNSAPDTGAFDPPPPAGRARLQAAARAEPS